MLWYRTSNRKLYSVCIVFYILKTVLQKTFSYSRTILNSNFCIGLVELCGIALLIKLKNNCQNLRSFKMVHQVCFLCFTTDILNLNFRLQVVCNFHVEMSEFNLKISLQNYKVKTIIVLDSIINPGPVWRVNFTSNLQNIMKAPERYSHVWSFLELNNKMLQSYNLN